MSEYPSNEQRYAVWLSSIGDGIIATDERTRVSFMNPAAEAMTGMTNDEALGQPLERVYRASSDGQQCVLESPSGPVPIDERRSPIVATPGTTAGVVLVFRDVTKQKRAEEALALRLAKRAADAANRAKDDFLANVSHEIRTPMNAILGMTELMLDTSLSDEQRHWLTTVKSASDSLLVIIDDLLDFAKIEAGKVELEQAPFSLRGELDDVLRILALRAHGKGLNLFGNISIDVPDEVVGDCGRLRQVLMNLVGNAIKFTQEGEVVVRVSVAERSPEGREVVLRFAVGDTGIGIPASKQAVIFEAFRQEDTSTTRKYGGTGLGLTIAARLVALMGGAISVVSEPSRGSTFAFTIVCGCQPISAAVVPAGRVASTNTAANVPITGLRILVAEDNDFNAELLRQLLERRGCRTVVSRAGDEALNHARLGTFDLLLLDLHMPGLDGFEVITQLRAGERESGDHLPVIALTARSRLEDRERCLAAGMDDFLVKPIRMRSLWEAIERVCDQEQRRAAGTDPIAPEALLAACDGDSNLLESIWQGLRTHLPAEQERLESSFERGDARAVSDAAHRLQGMLGAVSVAAEEVASEIEDLAELGALERSGVSIRRLRNMTRFILRESHGLSLVRLWHMLEQRGLS